MSARVGGLGTHCPKVMPRWSGRLFTYFRCECGRQFKVAADKRGRRAQCPECQVVFVVPAGDLDDDYMPLAVVVERLQRLPERPSSRALPCPPERPAPAVGEAPEDLSGMWDDYPRDLVAPARASGGTGEGSVPLEMGYWTALAYPLKPRARLMVLIAAIMFATTGGFWSLMITPLLDPHGANSAFLLVAILAVVPFFMIYAFFASFCLSIITNTCNEEDEVPDWPAFLDFWDDVARPSLRLLFLAMVCFLPFFICVSLGGGISLDPNGGALAFLALVLLVAGILYFSMALLASYSFETMLAANPVTVVRAIMRAGGDYLLLSGLLIAVSVTGLGMLRTLVGLLGATAFGGSWLAAMLLCFPPFIVALYTGMVLSRMLGLLYRRNRDKLGWDEIPEIKRREQAR